MAEKTVVPEDKDLRAQIIQMHHAPLYAGHRGRKKTHAAIEQTFWWPKMYLDVQHFVQTCDSCQRNKHDCETSRPSTAIAVTRQALGA
eukprot:101261-Pelagomonas_calceolata.AAC.2